MKRGQLQRNDSNPKELLNRARDFFRTAEIAFNQEPHRAPLNFLYFHSTELLLKAFLRAHGIFPLRNHDICQLHQDAVGQGLKIPDDVAGLHNIVHLLYAGNADDAFRYGTPQATFEPDLLWTRDVVKRLMEVVEATIDASKDSSSGPPVKFVIILGKPISGTGESSLRLSGLRIRMSKVIGLSEVSDDPTSRSGMTT